MEKVKTMLEKEMSKSQKSWKERSPNGKTEYHRDRRNVSLWLLKGEFEAINEASYRARSSRSAFIIEAVKDKMRSLDWPELATQMEEASIKHSEKKFKQKPRPAKTIEEEIKEFATQKYGLDKIKTVSL